MVTRHLSSRPSLLEPRNLDVPLLAVPLLESLEVAVYATDPSGYITRFNDAAAELWGRTPTVGSDLWCGSWRIYRPDGREMPLNECPMAVTLREGRAVRDVEIVVERPDGSRRNVLPHPSPLRDSDGALIGAVNVLVDITQWKRLAHEATFKLSSIVESSDDAIISKDLNGIIQSWNGGAERIFGYSADEAVGRSIRLVIPPERQDEEDAVLSQVRKGARVDHFETVRMRKDGAPIDISVTVSPLKDQDGTIIGASKVARDISEKKAAEKAIRESLAVKDQFLSLVSHELRTPISTVVANGSVLLRRGDLLSEDERQQALSDVVSEGQRLQSIIENLLLLTRLEGSAPEFEPILLNALMSERLEAYSKRKPAPPVSFEAPPQALVVKGRPSLLAMVIDNLVGNADKYSPAGSPIEIHLRTADNGQVEVSVRDNGIGVPESDLPNLFTPFYRAEVAKGYASGMGLGLAVCKRIVEVHSGRIWATQRPEGGSDFSFSLPRNVPRRADA